MDPVRSRSKRKGRRGSKYSPGRTSPLVSPNGYSALANQNTDEEGPSAKDEVWNCQDCKKKFSNLEAKLMECSRCKEHTCLKCLGKTEEDYHLASASDMFWFCPKCIEKVHRNIAVDREIEAKCKEMAIEFEARISKIEKTLSNTCSKAETKDMINKEIDKRLDEINAAAASVSAESTKQTDQQNQQKHKDGNINEVMQEIQRRAERESNILIHGVKETSLKTWQERLDYDMGKTKEVLEKCGVESPGEEIEKIVRVGKFNKEKMKRPICVTLKTKTKRVTYLKGR